MTQMIKVQFSAGDLWAIREDGEVWCPLAAACQALGVDEDTQRHKIQDTPWATWKVIMTSRPGDNQARKLFCVNLETLPMWLATIDSGRVDPAIQDKLVAYQREAAKVLRDHFFGPPAQTTFEFREEVRSVVREELRGMGLVRSSDVTQDLGDLPARLLKILQQAGRMSRTEISNAVGRHVRGGVISAALEALRTMGAADVDVNKNTGGRPRQVWSAKNGVA